MKDPYAGPSRFLSGVAVALFMLALPVAILLLAGGVPPAAASYRPGFQDEAEYSASGSSTYAFLPFANSDPAWGWRTTVAVQNTTDQDAGVTLNYYDAGGALISTVSQVLAPMGSRTFETPASFSGSLVVMGAQPVAVAAYDVPMDTDRVGDGLASYEAAPGAGLGSRLALMPVYRQHEGGSSQVGLQNPGEATVAASLTFYAKSGSWVMTLDASIPPHGTALYDAADLPGLGDDFEGLLVVESGGPDLAGVVKSQNALTGAAVAQSSCLVPGKPSPYRTYLPHLVEGQPSSIRVASMDPNGGTALIVYYDTAGGMWQGEPVTLGGYEQQTISLGGDGSPLPPGFEGSAFIEASVPVVAVAETPWLSDPATFTGHGARSQGASTLFAPYIRRDAGETTTMIYVSNLAEYQSDIVVTYYGEDGSVAGEESAQVPGKGSVLFDQGVGDLPIPFSGSARVSGSHFLATVLVSHRRPNTPALLSPPDGALLLTDTVTFTWSDVGAEGYNLNLNGTVVTTTQTYLSAELANGDYSWTVRAFGPPGNVSPYAPPWTLTVHFLAAPELYPIDNVDKNGDYLVDWSGVEGADGYLLEEDNNPAFESPLPRYQGSGTQFEVAGQSPGTWYYRVRAYDDVGSSGWSSTQDVSAYALLHLPLVLRGPAAP